MKGMRKMKKFFEEFKAFILRGNIVELAIGVIIGGAFNGLVTSLLDNIISPIIGCFNVGGFNSIHIKIWNANLYIGAFITDVVNFIIMALVVFLMLKGVMKLMSLAKKEKEAAPPEPSKEEVLLTEIRDLLKEQNKK